MRQGKRISLDAHPAFVAADVDEHIYLDALDDVITSLEEADVPFGALGGLAVAALGRPRTPRDIDVLVRPDDAGRALAALARCGFETNETDPAWLFEAFRSGVLVSVIFRAKGDVYLDDEMIARSVRTTYRGHVVRTVPVEDLIVIKAITHEEGCERHWFDALALIGQCTIDWEYLVKRARSAGARRVLSLLIYGHSRDLVVPDRVIRALFEATYPS